MPTKVDPAKEISYGDVENFAEEEKHNFQDFVKLKTAVGGNLYCAFYTIAEGARYLSIESESLLESIEKHTKYKLSDHIESMRVAFNNYESQSFNKVSRLSEKEVIIKSAYAEKFAQDNKLSIFDIDEIRDDFDGFDTAQPDWFDKLRRHSNQQLYHFIVGSYLATIYPQIKLPCKEAQGNNLNQEQLIGYGNYLFPDNLVSMDISSKYFSNQELSEIIDQDANLKLKEKAKQHLDYDEEKKLFYLPKDKHDFNNKIHQSTSPLEVEQLSQVLDICSSDKFKEVDSLHFHHDEGNGAGHFSALIPKERYSKFRQNTQTSLEGVELTYPSKSPTPQNTEQHSIIEAEKINNTLLSDFIQAKNGTDQNAIKEAQEQFNSPSTYSGLGLKVELVGDPPAEGIQEEFTYKYKITDCIAGGLASMFYHQNKEKDLHIVFECKPEEHDQVITRIRNLKKTKSVADDQKGPLFEIWSGIEGGGQIIAGGKSKLGSKSENIKLLYGISPLGEQSDIPEKKFYTKKQGNSYEAQSYEEYIGKSSKEPGASGAAVRSDGAGRGN